MENDPLISINDQYLHDRGKGSCCGRIRRIINKVPLPILTLLVVLLTIAAACSIFILRLAIFYVLPAPTEAVAVTKLTKTSNNIQNADINSSLGQSQEVKVISTPMGKLNPVISTSRDGREFYSFYKIPYAMPPTGDRRFKPPIPSEPWEGVRREIQVAPQCLQKEKYAPIVISTGEESCLFLNLYVPKKVANEVNTPKTLYPVMFYIHGGGFSNGNGSRYGAEYFMDEDVILITFQYRLGAFGFLNSMDGTISGNLGMKDQVMALKWVQENVEYFNGDPNRVTIFGNSAGAYSVSTHLVSSMSSGLFHRAIIQSGSVVCPGSFLLNPEDALKQLGNRFNCSTENMTEYTKCLQKVDGAELAVFQSKGGSETGSYEDPMYFISKENVQAEENGNVFVSDYPSILYNQGNVNKVPLIVGINSAEFNAFDYLRDHELIDSLNDNWIEEAPELFAYSADAINMSIAIEQFYFGGKEIGNETIKNFTNLISDRRMDHCSKVQAEYHTSYNDVYLYYLTKEPAKSYMAGSKKGYPEDSYGVAHADELQYFFPYSDYPVIPPDSEYYQFSKNLVKIWSQFANTGNPNGFADATNEWKSIKPKENFIQWFQLDDHMEMVETMLPRMKFWDAYPKKDLDYF